MKPEALVYCGVHGTRFSMQVLDHKLFELVCTKLVSSAAYASRAGACVHVHALALPDIGPRMYMHQLTLICRNRCVFDCSH